jgi:hypothetical protein
VFLSRDGYQLAKTVRSVLLVTLIAALSAKALHGAGSSLPSREEILQSVYPGTMQAAERIFLTEVETIKVKELTGKELPSPLIALYRVRRGDTVVGRAYVDTHVIRTKRESLLVCLDAKGQVKRVEVTAFLEPPEYKLSERWYEQYEKKSLESDLRLGQSIRSVAGATLTSRAAADAIRRVLAIDSVVVERSQGGTNE